MNYICSGSDLILKDVTCFNASLSADCGQAFRWKKKEDGTVHGIVGKKSVDFIESDSEIIFKNTTEDEFKTLLVPYFDLERDYEKIVNGFDDDNLKSAAKEFYGIRILKQDEWEALCSFIISQNNNIPRIKGIIERLCENFGEKNESGDYLFPSYNVIASLNEDDLSVLRAGFRNKYIIDAAKKVASGEVDFEKVRALPLMQAQDELTKIRGVGAKVAQCTLLYGFGKTDAFPVDVWVKKIMAEMYPNGLPECTRGCEGIAQQYLFHWRRNSERFIEK